MCKAAGFRRVEVVYDRSLIWRVGRLGKTAATRGWRAASEYGLKSVRQDRIILHAHK
jgi:hypothetical protein